MIDFFRKECVVEIDAKQFGICDDNDKLPAYPDTDNADNWIAIVQNENQKTIQFIAIDNCIPIWRAKGEMESRCDGMLFYEDNIDFVELKVVRNKWIQNGIIQLRITITNFLNVYEIDEFKRKRAFLTNSKHPQFKFSHKEQMQKFKQETGFRLVIAGAIKI
ncbi:MAG: hypothetical protein AAF849_04610 [Bacteroidota bacterium]